MLEMLARLLMVAAIAFSIFLFARVIEAHSHDAPKGWSYPSACCSGYDCREVGGRHSKAKVRVVETSQGYQITSTGEVIAWSDARLKDSPDGEYHWCSYAGADDSHTICLFVPPRSF